MDKDILESTINVGENVDKKGAMEMSENGYERYKGLGGIINKTDYHKTLEEAKITKTIDQLLIAQVKKTARIADITLNNSPDSLDPRIILYGILRRDTNTEGVEYHHSQMSDQRLFAEALRMSGDADSLQKLITTHPHISFT